MNEYRPKPIMIYNNNNRRLVTLAEHTSDQGKQTNKPKCLQAPTARRLAPAGNPPPQLSVLNPSEWPFIINLLLLLPPARSQLLDQDVAGGMRIFFNNEELLNTCKI